MIAAFEVPTECTLQSRLASSRGQQVGRVGGSCYCTHTATHRRGQMAVVSVHWILQCSKRSETSYDLAAGPRVM
jgi:hypothetical protein